MGRKVLVGKPEETTLETGVDGSLILKWLLQE
jgi:hypothetical protein